jgi:hypothetical protein
MPNENGSSRLDRIEHALELLIDDHIHFREEHKHLVVSESALIEKQQTIAFGPIRPYR